MEESNICCEILPDVLYSSCSIPGQLVTNSALLANTRVPSIVMKHTSDVTCVRSLKLTRNLLPRLPKYIPPSNTHDRTMFIVILTMNDGA